jgi:hypothetical protein
VTSLTPEPTLASIQREFPRWVCWRAASGLVHARRTDKPSSSGYDVKGEDPMDLRDEIIRADGHAQDEQS